MKIKITGTGWTGFSGYFGVIEFKDGVSVHDVSRAEAQRLGALVQVETLEGENPSVAQQIIDARTQPLATATTPPPEPPPPAPAMTYTAQELAEIADKGGIRALREVAEPFGVKGKGIAELIRELMALAPKPAEVSGPTAE